MLMEVDHATGRRRLVVRDGEAGDRTESFMELFQVTLASMSVDQFVLRGIESVGEWFATKTFMDSPLAPPRHTTPKRPLPNSR